MIKKIILLLIFLLSSSQLGFAKEVLVKLKPVYKVTTANINLQEGDAIEFIIVDDVVANSKIYLKKGQKASGVITVIENNDYLSKPAKLYVENVKTRDINNKLVKLKGVVYKSGNDHKEIMEFLNPYIVRGGEVQINPEKDEFILFIEEKL